MREVEILSRKERLRRFGVDCGDGLEWKGGTWAPGGDYSKKLIVRNVSDETIKLKYRLPQTKFFSMDFPELIKLSPGMAYTVSVIFRPIRYEKYDDHIEFIIRKKSFFVPIKARLSKIATAIPSHLDFGFCTVNEVTEKTFLLRNVGEIPAKFSWKLKSPITLSPESGTVQPGKATTITARFLPSDAKVVVSQAVLLTEGLAPKTFKISAISKYPHLSASETSIDFGERLCGAAGAAEKEIEVRNHSDVPVSYEIVRVESDCDPVFFFSPTRGVIEANAAASFRVKYTPLTHGKFSCDSYSFITPGGNTLHIRCAGSAAGPRVEVSVKQPPQLPGMPPPDRSDAAFFGDVRVGKCSSRVVVVTNASTVPIHYQFVCDPDGIFQFADGTQGIVSAGLSKSVVITFRPRMPGNYFKRVFFFARDQEASFVDFVGTAFDDDVRPQPLLVRHVDAHRKRQVAGRSFEGPDEIMQLAARGEDPGAADGIDLPEYDGEWTRSGETTRGRIEVFRQCFLGCDDPTREVSVREREVDFGGSAGDVQRKVVHVTNRTAAKVVCAWNVSSGAFKFHPPAADIAAGETARFEVAFYPQKENYYFCEHTEAHVYFKTNRTFRLVNDEAFVPPWCVSVRLKGHSFPPTVEQFLPKVAFGIHGDAQKIEFPPCHVGDSCYATFLLENSGDTPSMFAFGEDPAGNFAVVPSAGMMPAHSFQIVAVRFAPTSAARSSCEIMCTLNGIAENSQRIQFSGMGCVPFVKRLDVAYIKPTALGLVSEAIVVVENSSRVPLLYDWSLSKSAAAIVDVTPSSGCLRGNERIEARWKFAPVSVGGATVSAPLIVRSLGASRGEVAQRCRLTILAEGTEKQVSIEPGSIDFGTFLVGTTSSRGIMIVNAGDCDLVYRLVARLADDGEAAIVFDRPNGVLTARSRTRVTATFSPLLSGTFECDISCELCEAHSSDAAAFITNERDLGTSVNLWGDAGAAARSPTATSQIACAAKGSAAYPVLGVADARSPMLSAARIWKQLGIDELNRSLKTPLTNHELALKRSTGMKGGESSWDTFDLAFTPAPANSPPEVISLLLKNTGYLPVSFRLKFPNDSDIEVEPWADAGEPTPEELMRTNILDSGLFDIQPRSGSLAAGEALTIKLSYKYTMLEYDGTHVIPVELCLENGKHVILRLIGRTLDQGQPLLFFPGLAEKVWLKDVPIGSATPCEQSIQVHNPSAVGVDVRIDAGELDELTRANYDFCVLDCAKKAGCLSIAPFSSCEIPFVFAPIEAKEYSAAIHLDYGPIDDFSEERDERFRLTLPIAGRGFIPGETAASSYGRAWFVSPGEPERGPPKAQLLALANQLGMFAVDNMSFGAAPQGAIVRRVTALKNLSSHHLRFQFDEDCPLLKSGWMQIQPISGTVAPGAFVALKVTLRADQIAEPCIVEKTIGCVVTTIGGESGGLERASLKHGRSVSRASSAGTKERRLKREETHAHQSVMERSTASRDNRLRETAIMRQLKSGGLEDVENSLIPEESFGAPGSSSWYDPRGSRASDTRESNRALTGSPVSGVGPVPSTANSVRSIRSSRSIRSGRSVRYGHHAVHEVELSWRLHLQISAQILSKDEVRSGFLGGSRDVCYAPKADKGEVLKSLGRGDEFAPVRSVSQWGIPLVGEDGDEEKVTSDADTAVDEQQQQQRDGETVLANLLREALRDSSVNAAAANLPARSAPYYASRLADGGSERRMELMKAEKMRRTLLIPECQHLAETVLENTVFNLVQEALHGDVDLLNARGETFVVDDTDE